VSYAGGVDIFYGWQFISINRCVSRKYIRHRYGFKKVMENRNSIILRKFWKAASLGYWEEKKY
jgi:hypothetical protein